MAIIAIIILVLAGFWLLPSAIRAIEASLSTRKLSNELRDGRVDIVKLFEQGLPRAAKEKFEILCQRAEIHCKQKDIAPHEYSTLFPALIELIDTYFTTETRWSTRKSESGKKLGPSVCNISEKVAPSLVHMNWGIVPEPSKEELFAFTMKSISDSLKKHNSNLVSEKENQPIKITSANPVSVNPQLKPTGAPVNQQEKTLNPYVTIVPNPITGVLVNTYQGAPQYGYVQLKSETTSLEGEWLRKKKRAALLRGEVIQLEEFIKGAAKDGMLPGTIIIREFLESELPDQFSTRIDKTRNYEDAVAHYLKRAPNGGPNLTFRGERILRFSDWVPAPTETDVDVFIKHDNLEEVKAWEQTLSTKNPN